VESQRALLDPSGEATTVAPTLTALRGVKESELSPDHRELLED